MTTDAKRVYIYMSDEQHVQMRIRLDYHGMGMSEFVRACSQALIDGNPIIENFVDDYKEKSAKHSKKIEKLKKKDKEKAERLNAAFSNEELDQLFDLIEEDSNDF